MPIINYTDKLQSLLNNIINNNNNYIIDNEIKLYMDYYDNNIDIYNLLIYYISKYKLQHIYKINYQNNSNKPIILITQFFITNNTTRQYELNNCLTLNILNNNIDTILLLTEEFIDIKKYLTLDINIKTLLKVRQIIINKRLTLYTALEYCNKDNHIYIISNSDIFFNNTLNIIKTVNLNNKVFALSRYDLLDNYKHNKSNQIKIFTHDGNYGNPVIDSHDVWICNNIKNDIRLDIPLGTCGIDNIANYIFTENGYEVINPLFDIQIIHYHLDLSRNDTINGIRNNSNKNIILDYTDLQIPYKYIQQQKLEIIHDIKSICTLCTNTLYYTDLKILLSSILEFESHINIYILCDSYVFNKVLIDFPTLNIYCKIGLDKYSNMNRSQMEEHNLFKDLCFEKINCINFAFEFCENTLYLDADIILLHKLDLHIPIIYDLALSPHYILKESTDLYGYYNAGMIFTSNNNLGNIWNQYKDNSRFLDQSCLELFKNHFNIFELNYNYNFGWWRLFQCNNSNERLNNFTICKYNNILLYDSYPLICIHTHLFSNNDIQTINFNNIIINLIKNNSNYKWLESILYNKLPTIYIPTQPRTDLHNHSNDSFRELIYLWEEHKLVNIKEYDGKYIFFNNINDILLYDRPTLEWLENDIIYNIGLFGNPILPINSYLNSLWTFWPRQPKLLQLFITNNTYNTFQQRYIHSIFIGNIENDIQNMYRSNIWESYIDFFELTYTSIHKYTHNDYLKLLSFSKFGLCLRGFGPKCNRDIEYLALGVVLLITDLDILHYYNKLIENQHYIFINNPQDLLKLHNISETTWNYMSSSCIEWYNNYASINGSFNTTINIINSIKNNPIKNNPIINNPIINNYNIIVNEGLQKKFNRTFPKSLDNIQYILELHNNNHTPIDWNNNCNFDRIQELTINEIINTNNISIYNNGTIFYNNESYNLNNKIINIDDSNSILFNFVQEWGYGYYHFICEILPRILYYIKHKSNTNFKNKTIYFILYYNTTFILPILKLLPELSGIKIIPYDNNTYYNINNNTKLYNITPTISGNPSIEGISLINQYLINNIAPYEEYCIIIKRNESDRTINNFNNVVDTIKSIFINENWIIYDNINIENTIHLFNNAKLIIGIHGAGLSNIVFSNKNTYILEFIPELNFNCCYWHLANLLQLNYIMMPILNYNGNSSCNIDLEQLKKYINYIYDKLNYLSYNYLY